mgnify:CR=1 FL=1
MIFDWFKSLFVGEISDEEVNARDWVLCPRCEVHIEKCDLESNNGKCLNCGHQIFENISESW